ncbi:nitrile hydratase subunit alpha [Synechococcus sp. 7002]|uniref:nitrile hydratase subunit alpha n=1 Tax=Synechococcus sp. 7002 TaxID=1938862 RepID=UPI001F3852FB|nr:nitrile hydratase subunit alpha [Synechococcus sp. 7002]
MPSNYPGFKYGADREAVSAAKVKALESLLIEKGIITGDTVDNILGYFETQMGHLMGQN